MERGCRPTYEGLDPEILDIEVYYEMVKNIKSNINYLNYTFKKNAYLMRKIEIVWPDRAGRSPDISISTVIRRSN